MTTSLGSPSSTPLTPDTGAQQFWVFQYRPDVAANREASTEGDVIPWKLTAHKLRVRVGDVVFFWRSGAGAGLTGWGVIEGAPTPSPSEGFDRIDVRTAVVFPQPIRRDVVREVPEVSGLRVVTQGSQGSNFQASTLQALGLARLIRQHGYGAPEVNVGEARDVVRRRLQRDLAQVREAIGSLPLSARESLEHRVAALFQALVPENPDAGKISEQLEALKRDAERASTDQNQPDGANLGSDIRRAIEQAAANAPDLRHIDAPGLDAALPTQGDGSAAGAAPEAVPSPPAAPPEPPPIPATAPPDYWHWPAKDRVGIGAEVVNLARYIAHEGLRPPQAVGIFGEWGSGKSFFMRALKSQIGITAWQSRHAIEAGRRTVFCSRIVQIDFNAWHYVESNLWASLAGTIFERLHEAIVEEAKKDPAKGLDANALFQSLATYREATEERNRQASVVADLQGQRDKLVSTLDTESKTVRAALEAAASVTVDVAREQLDALNAEQRDRIFKLVGAKTVNEMTKSVDELQGVVADATTLKKQAEVELRTMGAKGYVIAAIAIAVALVAVPYLADWLRNVIATIWPAVKNNPGVANLVFKIGGYLGAAAVGLRRLIAAGRKVLTLASTTHQRLRAEVARRAEARRPELIAAQAKLDIARQSLSESEETLRKHREELASIEAALREASPGVRLKSFLEQRVRDKSYEQHLGLISLVRRDFQTLSDRMHDYWSTRVSGNPFAEVDVVNEDGTTTKARVPFIERIILYVDDLDRCPPEKVVDVLQAVHLLLGFQLFVVVVAVDVRWVGQSLSRHYGDLLSTSIFAQKGSDSWERATSDDYLEKIFQIPYRIVPMSGEMVEDFVSAKLREPFIGSEATQADVEVPSIDLEPKEFSLHPPEAKCIELLHACLGRSPRRVERFVNVYRLMRAGMEDGQVESLIREQQYRQLLALFALLTGSARLGPKVIEEMYRGAVAGSIASTQIGAWLKKLPDLAMYDEEEVTSASRVAAYLDGLNDAMTMDRVRDWVPHVAQYSFREVRLRSS